MDDILLQSLVTATMTTLLYFIQNRKLIKANQKEIEKLKGFITMKGYVKEIEEEQAKSI